MNNLIDILIVDDRSDGLIALEAILHRPDLNIVKAQSGSEALSLINNYEFAVILLDVQMPGLDGFETAELIRKNPRYKLTPLIFVTAINKDDRYIYKGYEAGAVDYIFKPFEPQILRSKVNIFVELFIKSKQLEAQAELVRKSERQERYLRLAELELESLKRYSNLADAIPHMIWKAGVDGRINYFNKVWSDYTGFSQEQSMGTGWQKAIRPEEVDRLLKFWLESMTTQKEFSFESEIRRKDGEYRWHHVRAVPEFKNSHHLVAWIGTCTDIHDRKIAEKEAHAANIAKSNFLANMSHEIRNPLGIMLGFADLMLNPKQTQEERLHAISTIRRSGRQLLRIIDEILDLSKVEAGRLEVENIEVNLISLIAEFLSFLNIQAKVKNLQLDFKLKSKLPEFIFSDPTRLRQIIMNIVGNALKFTEKGQVTVEIDWQPSGKLTFNVIDTGLGMPVTEADKLFRPFVQIDSSTTRRFGGTGLGLVLSKKLAEALGGNVYLKKTELGVGSTFTIEVQAPPKTGTKFVNSLKANNDEATVEKDSQQLKDMNVLLVDDAQDNQLIIGHFLKSAGAQVEIASDGKEGVQKALAGHFDVVLMDIQMPLLDGYEATSQLRLKGYKTPIIALTAHAMKEQKDRCLRAGCTDHLSKPVDRRKLIAELAKFAGPKQQIIYN